jgi:pyruvate,water dikinase
MSNIFLTWYSDSDPLSDQTHHEHIKLAQAKFPIPPGFIITTNAYFSFLKENNLDHKIQQLLSTISIEHSDSLMQGEHHIKKLFDEAQLSDTFISDLTNFYQKLGKNEVILTLHEKESRGRKHAAITVISEYELLKEIKKLWAEMFTGNALWHRHHRDLNHLTTGAEIIIQRKITGDTRGTVITIDPVTHAKDKLVIKTNYPHSGDTYILSKKNLSIIDRTLLHKSNAPKLSHDEILKIAELAKKIENYLYFPQEIIWAIDNNELFVLKVKPITSLPQEQKKQIKKLPVTRGKGVTNMIGTGKIFIIKTTKDLQKIKPHDVIVVPNLEFKHLKRLKKPCAIIIETHTFPTQISIVLKQKGIPTITNVKEAKKHFHSGNVVTVNGKNGEIYFGGFL